MVIAIEHNPEPFLTSINDLTINDTTSQISELSIVELDRPNPNFNSFSAAISCYPIISQIAHHLDLNSLHDLSATCRQFRENLLQNRTQLIRQTLRCTNEQLDIGSRLADRMREWRGAAGVRSSSAAQMSLGGSRITSGRVGTCARDLVAECRRCGVVVCRNCTVKPPPPRALVERHRRLCRTCLKAPLRAHTGPNRARDYGVELDIIPSFTDPAFSRSPCCCPDVVHMCLSCGNALRNADTTYIRGWTWRTRYSYLGGLATGIGGGNEGVECGKGNSCLAAHEVEKEIECDAQELAKLTRELETMEVEVNSDGTHYGDGRPGYFRQEVEGIGGVVKKKVKRRVRVGEAVGEWEDEKVSEDFLRRERDGKNRSWCAWCERVIPSKEDKAEMEGLTDSSR